MKSRLLAAIVAAAALVILSTAPVAQTARDTASTEAAKPAAAADAAKARKAAPKQATTESPKAVETQGTKPASLRKSPAYDGAGSDCHHGSKESDA